jgi:uncharacterized protein (DUF488 family)
VELHTIGFAGWSAEGFFGALRAAGVTDLIDVRLRPASQLAGFAKQGDLAFLLRELAGVAYQHRLELAPTTELLAGYRKGGLGWPDYEAAYLALLEERRVTEHLSPTDLGERPILLCSEHDPGRCHRRLAADHLAARWSTPIEVRHL